MARFDDARAMAEEMVVDRMLQVVNTVTPETASADRVKLAGLSAISARQAARPAPPQTMTIRFVEPNGEVTWANERGMIPAGR